MRKYAVSHEPKGYRDVYWCHRLNEPVFLERFLLTDKFHCSLCNESWPIEEDSTEDHKFICHIVSWIQDDRKSPTKVKEGKD